MKKEFKLYIIVWSVFLVLFNIISFISPALFSEDKYTSSFWIGYIFITLMFVGQFCCSFIAFKADSAQKMFYNISLLRTSYIGLVACFAVGSICMLISPLPYWIGAILCAAITVFNIISIVKATVAIDAVSRIDEKIKVQTFFIKSLTVDADTLMASARSEEAKAECRKVYEAIRYSDPMSNDALTSVEGQISIKFAQLSEMVKADDIVKVKELANEVIILVGDRNKKCKLLK